MKIVKTYVNELTGEEFTTRSECVASEKDTLSDMVKDLTSTYQLIDSVCDEHTCSTCPLRPREGVCLHNLLNVSTLTPRLKRLQEDGVFFYSRRSN